MISAGPGPNTPPCLLIQFLKFASPLLNDELTFDLSILTSCLRLSSLFPPGRRIKAVTCAVPQHQAFLIIILQDYFLFNVFQLFYDSVVPKSLKAPEV